MTTIIDFILDLFRSPAVAAQFVSDPEGTMRDAGLPNVSAAQLQAIAASAAPAGVALGGGDPIVGLQRAVADHHQIAQNFVTPLAPQANLLSPQTTYAPERTFAPETNTDLASHNNTNAEFLSPDTQSGPAGANSQVGGLNLGFGDITFGPKTTTTNTATDGGVVVGGDNAGDIVSGDGAVLGNGNTVNNGHIRTGDGSSVVVGHGNDVDSSSQFAGGDIVQDNNGPVVKDIDLSGGHSSGGSGGGGLIGLGKGGDSAGGNGGSLIIDSGQHSTVGGDQTSTAVGNNLSGGVGDSSSLVQDNSSHTDSSTDLFAHDSVVGTSSHTDSSTDLFAHDSVVGTSSHTDSSTDLFAHDSAVGTFAPDTHSQDNPVDTAAVQHTDPVGSLLY